MTGIGNTLVDSNSEKFHIMNRVRVSDGQSGFFTTWTEGPEFDASMAIDGSTEAQIARAQGLVLGITFYVNKSIELDYNDVIRRVSNQKTYRITSDPHKTPAKSKLNLRTVTAELWNIPNTGE